MFMCMGPKQEQGPGRLDWKKPNDESGLILALSALVSPGPSGALIEPPTGSTDQRLGVSNQGEEENEGTQPLEDDTEAPSTNTSVVNKPVGHHHHGAGSHGSGSGPLGRRIVARFHHIVEEDISKKPGDCRRKHSEASVGTIQECHSEYHHPNARYLCSNIQ